MTESNYSIETSVAKREVILRCAGTFDVATITKLVGEYKQATDKLNGEKHVVLADMRGLKTMSEEVATIFGEAIMYGREKGTVRCAHLADSAIQRLQAKRMAREATPNDPITVDVVDEDEAHKVLDEARAELS